MNEIIRVVRQAHHRLAWQSTAQVVARCLVGLLCIACLLILAEKLLFVGAPLLYTGLGAAGLALALMAFFSWRRLPAHGKAALEVDERLGLSERISSALVLQRDPSPMARAVVADARAYAKNIPVADTFPMHFPRETWAVFTAAAVALLLLYFMPQYDLLGRRKALEVAKQEQQAAQKQARVMRQQFKRMKKAIPANPPERVQQNLDKIDEIIKEMEKGKLTKAEAMAKLRKVDDILRDEQKQMAKNPLSPAENKRTDFGMAQNMAEKLAKKDYQKAAEELKKLAEAAQNGQLTEKQKEQLQKAMKQLAEQLNKEGDNQKLCDALKKMAENMGEGKINPADMKKALQQCELAMKDKEQLEELIKQCRGMCKGCRNGPGGGKKIANAGQPFEGLFTPGEDRKEGGGMNKAGIGRGGAAPIQPENVAFQDEQVKGELKQGRMIGSYFVNGKQVKGEARAEYSEVVESARTEATEALAQEQIPRAYQGYVRDYFEEMKTQ